MTERVRFPPAAVLVRNFYQVYAAEETKDWWIATEWTQASIMVRVQRIGGRQINLVTDQPRMLTEVFGPDSSTAEDVAIELAEVTNHLVDDLQIVDGLGSFHVRRVEWFSGPVLFPDENQRPRAQFSFAFDVRGLVQ